MKNVLNRTGRALLMGVMWGVAWSPIGLIIGYIVDRDGSMDEPWIAVGTLPGFFSGVAFAVLLTIVARGRRFEALSIAGVSGWGALAGLVVPVFAFSAGELSEKLGSPVLFIASVTTAIVLLSAASAAGTLALAGRGNFNLMDRAARGLEARR